MHITVLGEVGYRDIHARCLKLLSVCAQTKV
jgi:hypothetical protein